MRPLTPHQKWLHSHLALKKGPDPVPKPPRKPKVIIRHWRVDKETACSRAGYYIEWAETVEQVSCKACRRWAGV